MQFRSSNVVFESLQRIVGPPHLRAVVARPPAFARIAPGLCLEVLRLCRIPELAVLLGERPLQPRNRRMRLRKVALVLLLQGARVSAARCLAAEQTPREQRRTRAAVIIFTFVLAVAMPRGD